MSVTFTIADKVLGEVRTFVEECCPYADMKHIEWLSPTALRFEVDFLGYVFEELFAPNVIIQQPKLAGAK